MPKKASDRRTVAGLRPPSYVSKATLAAELDISETTVESYVQRGILPKPVRIGGSVRWNWAQVDAALGAQSESPEADPFMQGLNNVT
ncbi:transcriptional regulator [Rhodobacteraceae bacterium 2376]|uniref:Transcriptional regulator n=1 Tax=Rhabdonatronobacter sediminivivens TaxID=2743469 RepID=A0A7Z0HYL4_9RHOB|nr:transcriptional regulator [Rhabdonatronobacter sediminivivens]NYS24595.1 transcriptional regulator [Rhabdonatronobacter sediminivivens]